MWGYQASCHTCTKVEELEARTEAAADLEVQALGWTVKKQPLTDLYDNKFGEVTILACPRCAETIAKALQG